MGNEVTLPCEIQDVLQRAEQSILPDVSIDVSLQKYSSPNSDQVLQRYYTETLADANTFDKLPDYVNNLGAALTPLRRVPNGVGLGAWIISMFLEMMMPGLSAGTPEKKSDTREMLLRVFDDETSREIRVTMDTYMKDAAIGIDNPAAAHHLEVAQNTARILSRELTSLRDVMMKRQMTSRYLKQWVNGAAFHVLLRAHMANIKHSECGMDCSRAERSAARIALAVYQSRLAELLDKYKQYKISTTRFKVGQDCKAISRTYMDHNVIVNCHNICSIEDEETEKRVEIDCDEILSHTVGRTIYIICPSSPQDIASYSNEYVERMFSRPPISGLTTYFADLRSNLNGLMTRPGDFRASCTEVRKTYRYVQCN